MSTPPLPLEHEDLLLSIDCGTQSVRALLFDPRGTLVAKSQVALEDYVIPRPGWMEHDVDAFWGACAAACRQLWVGHPEWRVAVRGVGVTTQRGTIMPVDKRVPRRLTNSAGSAAALSVGRTASQADRASSALPPTGTRRILLRLPSTVTSPCSTE